MKTAISAVIKQNNNHEITGQVLQTTLLAMVDSLAGGYLFKGVATPSTVVGTPDENVFYIGGAGTYSNFGATPVQVPLGGFGIFTYNGSFTNYVLPSGGALDISLLNASGGTLAQYASLSAALAAIPESLQRGGMEIKYVQTSDNNYVKFFCTADEFTTDVTKWQGVDDEPVAGSNNLIESGGVLNLNKTSFIQNGVKDNIDINSFIKELYIDSSLAENVLYIRNFGYRTNHSDFSITITIEGDANYSQVFSTNYNGEIISLNDGKVKFILKNMPALIGFTYVSTNTDNTKFVLKNSVGTNRLYHTSIFQSGLIIDNTPVENSPNPVSSGGVFAEVSSTNNNVTVLKEQTAANDETIIVSKEWEGYDDKIINAESSSPDAPEAGSLSDSDDYKVTPLIECKKGQIVKYNLYTPSTVLAIAFYKNDTFVEGFASASIGELPLEYTVPDDGYIRLCCKKTFILNSLVKIINKDYTYNTIFDPFNSIKLQRTIGKITPKFELGNISGITPSYIPNRKRVRTPKGYPFYLCAGDKIGLSSYAEALFTVWFSAEGDSYSSIGNKSADYIIENDGYYLVLIKRNTEVSLNSVDELSSLFFAEVKYKEKESLENAEFEALYTNFPDKELELVNKVLSDKDSNTITFGLITDTHNSGLANRRTAKHGYYLSKFSELVGASFVVHLGDVINGYGETRQENLNYLIEYWRQSHRTFLPSFYTIAHHEQYGDGGFQVPSSATPEECIGIYGLQNKYKQVVWGVEKTCWHFDEGGIRFIGLNSSSQGSVGYSTDVVNFLTSALNGCTTPVICMAHMASNGSINYGNPINSAQIEAALSNYPNGVLAFFHGHTHWDMIWKLDSVPFLYWSTCCAQPVKLAFNYKYAPSIGVPEDYTREVGKYSEFCMDIVNIHKDTGIIKSFRFGAGYDRVAKTGLTVNVGQTLTLQSSLSGTIEWDIYDSTSGYVKDSTEQTATQVITRNVATINNGIVTALSSGGSIAVAFNGTAKEFFYIKVE